MSPKLEEKPMVYLSIPYKGSECESYEIANKVAGALMAKGYVVFSPISHAHAISEMCDLETNRSFWELQDRCFVERTDEVFVICADGWDKSAGVTSDIDYANELGKRVRFLDIAGVGDGEYIIKDHSCKKFEPFTIELD